MSLTLPYSFALSLWIIISWQHLHTALIEAAINDEAGVMKILLDAGANKEAVDYVSQHKHTRIFPVQEDGWIFFIIYPEVHCSLHILNLKAFHCLHQLWHSKSAQRLWRHRIMVISLPRSSYLRKALTLRLKIRWLCVAKCGPMCSGGASKSVFIIFLSRLLQLHVSCPFCSYCSLSKRMATLLCLVPQCEVMVLSSSFFWNQALLWTLRAMLVLSTCTQKPANAREKSIGRIFMLSTPCVLLRYPRHFPLF